MRITALIVLLLILSLVVVSSYKGYCFIKKDNLQLSWDEYIHYELSIYYFARLFRHSLLFTPLSPVNHKAPLFYLTITLSYLFFPVTQDTARIVNLFYIILMLVLMSVIEWNVSRKRIYSPFIFFIIPVFIYYAVRYVWPWITVSAIFLMLLALITRDLTKIPAWLLGIVIGLGILAKQTFVVFAFYPMLVYSWVNLRALGWRKTLIKLLAIAIVVLAVAGWFYIPRLNPIISTYGSNVWGAEVAENEDLSSLFSASHFGFYVIQALNWIPELVSAVFVAFTLYYIIYYKKEKNNKMNILLLSFFIPLFIFSIIVFRKDLRFILPLFTLIPVIIGVIINRFVSRDYVAWAVYAVLFIMALNMINATFNTLAPIHTARDKINAMVIKENPEYIVLYDFYPRFYFNFRELKILKKINSTIIDCVFISPDADECKHHMNDSFVFYTPEPFCKNPKIQYEKRFCKAYFKNKKYFLENYDLKKAIGKFTFPYKDKKGEIIVLKNE